MIRLLKTAVFTAFIALTALFGPLTAGQYAYAAKDVPAFSNYVVDKANVLDQANEDRINAELKAYQERSNNQIAILLIDSTGDQSIEDYAVDVGNKWGIGKKGKDNGVLVVLAMKDHQGRIEVGYGLQGQLTDVGSRDILETQIFPRFKEGDISGGVIAGEQAIRSALGDNIAAPVPMERTPHLKPQHRTSLTWLFVFIAVTVGSFFGSSRRSRRKGALYGGTTGWMLGGGGFGGGFGGGGSGGSGGFGGGSFGGGSGGFGGGGGGSFGGGGASGSW